MVKELSSEECADYATTLTETAREKNGTYMTAQFNGHFLAARIKIKFMCEKPVGRDIRWGRRFQYNPYGKDTGHKRNDQQQPALLSGLVIMRFSTSAATICS